MLTLAIISIIYTIGGVRCPCPEHLFYNMRNYSVRKKIVRKSANGRIGGCLFALCWKPCASHYVCTASSRLTYLRRYEAVKNAKTVAVPFIAEIKLEVGRA
jgi:hypothetical protein